MSGLEDRRRVGGSGGGNTSSRCVGACVRASSGAAGSRSLNLLEEAGKTQSQRFFLEGERRRVVPNQGFLCRDARPARGSLF